MSEEKEVVKKEVGFDVDCPIHGEGNYLSFTYDNHLWGERLCFRCAAEVMNDLVAEKQKRFLEHKSNE